MSATTITLPKTEYQRLKLQAKAYQKIMAKFFELAVKDPPVFRTGTPKRVSCF